MDRIEKIKKMQKEGYKRDRPQSMIVNNFYMLATIVSVSIAISLYTSYIAPSHIEDNKRRLLQEKIAAEIELERQKEQEYQQMRKKQIELAHKLNQRDYNDTNSK